MEVLVELSKKTTILFPADLHEELVRLAKSKGCSIGALIRDAVQRQYGITSAADRIRAAAELVDLQLPVDDVEQMIAQSTLNCTAICSYGR